MIGRPQRARYRRTARAAVIPRLQARGMVDSVEHHGRGQRHEGHPRGRFSICSNTCMSTGFTGWWSQPGARAGGWSLCLPQPVVVTDQHVAATGRL